MTASAYGQVVWRTMAGDDPAWSSPTFDDSAWNITAPPSRRVLGVTEIGKPVPDSRGSLQWHRASISLLPELAHQSLAVGMGPLNDAFEVYVEGVAIGKFGSWEPKQTFYSERHLSFRIPDGLVHGPLVHLAIRRWQYRAQVNTYLSLQGAGNTYLTHGPIVAPAELVVSTEQRHVLQCVAANAVALLTGILILCCGLASLALFSGQPRRKEYLWLGLHLILTGGPRLASLPVGLMAIPILSPFPFLLVILGMGGPVLTGYFFLAEVAPPLRRILRWIGLVVVVLYLDAIVFTFLGQSSFAVPARQLSTWLLIVPGAIAPLAVAWFCVREGRFDSVVLALVLVVRTSIEYFRSELSLLLGGTIARFPLGFLLIDPRDVGNLIFALTAVAVLWSRYKTAQRRQATVEQDLAAAREVQQLVLGGSMPATPGFVVDAVYRPAQEVGGDFYQVFPGTDGSLLVVIGDVSGKGMKAAMLVSAVIGSLRTQISRTPADVLAAVNRALAGQSAGGFVTCCCALFHADGRVEIANAGHLSPYLGGGEIAMESGIPLGILPEASWGQTTLHLKEGRMMLLSDGVVEARNGRGELLGFAMASAMSMRSAGDVADAAQAHGQDDDITVVTVQRAVPVSAVWSAASAPGLR